MPGPNPFVIPRRRATKLDRPLRPASLLLTSCNIAAVSVLVATTTWARRWLFSACALESILLTYGDFTASRVFANVPLWTLLATLNLTYAVCSTSWLLSTCFTLACCPLILATSLFQSSLVADFVRKRLRATLKQLHFARDKIALFDLPALEIDTDVDGLLVVRGLTISLSSLTIVAHGIELGLKLAHDIELSMYADQVHISLFRGIDVGDVFANVKGLGNVEMTFAELDTEEQASNDDESMFLGDTPLLRAATAGSEGFKDRPKLRHSLTGVGWMQDSSLQDGIDGVKTLSPDDETAERQYKDILTEIRTSSPVYQSRQHVLQKSKDDKTFVIENEKDMRAVVCAELHGVPSISHPPKRSIRVTTLQSLSRPGVRRFLDRVFKHYADHNAELRRLIEKVSAWLADAHFCLQLDDINAVGQVSISTDYDIVSYLHFSDVMAYRTALEHDSQSSANEGAEQAQTPERSSKRQKRPMEELERIAQVVRLGGADATCTIPSFLLPHHEHLLPAKPTIKDEESQSHRVGDADGKPKTLQAQKDLEQIQKDETNISMSVHGSLPACFDQSLLNFIAALVKASKIIELEKIADEVEADPNSTESREDDDVSSIAISDSPKINNSGFRTFTKSLRHGLADGHTRNAIRELAKDVHQSTKDSLKKAVVGGVINDRWIAKMVGKVAAHLEKAQGDVGYSGNIPVALDFYRANGESASKLLP